MAGSHFNLFGLSQPQFETLLLILIRVSTMLATFPIFSAREIPNLVKVGLGFLITFAIAQTVPTIPGGLGLGELAVAVAAQIFIGLVTGFIAYLVFTGVQFAGEVIDLQIGFAIANILNPITQQQITVIGNFQLALATIIYLAADAHHQLLQGIAGSFALIPLPYATPDPIVARDLATFFTLALGLVFRIAAPAAIALFVTNVALGLMARVAPQMNIFAVGFPLQIGVGMITLLIGLPLLGYVLPQVFDETPRQMDMVMRGMAVTPSPTPSAAPFSTPVPLATVR